MTRYQLSLSATGLKKSFTYGYPNPYCVAKIAGGQLKGTILGRTETINCNRDPDFTQVIYIETMDITTSMDVQICIFDDRDRSGDNTDKKIAETVFDLATIYSSKGRLLSQSCIYEGSIRIHASLEESIKGTDDPNATIHLHLRGLELKNVEPGLFGLGRSDPYFVIARKNFDHNAGIVHWNTIYQSEYIRNHLNPYWKRIDGTLTLEELCYGDVHWPLKITVYDYNKNNIKNKYIGELETSVTQLLNRVSIRGNADRENALELHKFDTSTDMSTDVRGYIVVLDAKINYSNNNQREGGNVVVSEEAQTDNPDKD